MRSLYLTVILLQQALLSRSLTFLEKQKLLIEEQWSKARKPSEEPEEPTKIIYEYYYDEDVPEVVVQDAAVLDQSTAYIQIHNVDDDEYYEDDEPEERADSSPPEPQKITNQDVINSRITEKSRRRDDVRKRIFETMGLSDPGLKEKEELVKRIQEAQAAKAKKIMVIDPLSVPRSTVMNPMLFELTNTTVCTCRNGTDSNEVRLYREELITGKRRSKKKKKSNRGSKEQVSKFTSKILESRSGVAGAMEGSKSSSGAAMGGSDSKVAGKIDQDMSSMEDRLNQVLSSVMLVDSVNQTLMDSLRKTSTSCEALVCSTCKLLVTEFGKAIHNFKKKRSLSLEAIADNVCQAREFVLKYHPFAKFMCTHLYNNESYPVFRDITYKHFEPYAQDLYQHIATTKVLRSLEQEVCVESYYCYEDTFAFQSKPMSLYEEQWSEECFVCRAVARDLEEQVNVVDQMFEQESTRMVRDVCNRLNLDSYYHSLCEELLNDSALPRFEDDIAWQLRSFMADVKGGVSTEPFLDKLCDSTLHVCHKWIDPATIKVKLPDEDVAYY